MVVETVDHFHVKMKKIVGFLTASYSSHYELDLLLQKTFDFKTVQTSFVGTRTHANNITNISMQFFH